MTEDAQGRWDEYVRAARNRGFGEIPLRSTAAVAPFSRAGMQAAANLVRKAVNATYDGDHDRARSYITRAVALPYDDHEQTAPAAWEGHMALFTAITDSLEDATENDEAWLDAAHSVFATASDAMRFEFRDAFIGIGESYELSARERKRVRRLIAPVPDRAELGDLNLPPEDLADTLVDLVRTVVAYETMLDQL